MTSTLGRELIELKAKHYRVTELPSTRARIVAMRKIDWGGAGQISEALGQDRCGSFLFINRYFFSLLWTSSPEGRAHGT